MCANGGRQHGIATVAPLRCSISARIDAFASNDDVIFAPPPSPSDYTMMTPHPPYAEATLYAEATSSLTKSHLLRITTETLRARTYDKPCLYFLEGNCRKGRNCPYNHDITEIEKINITCKAWKDGNCRWGKWCRYMHEDPREICIHHQQGNCKYGDKCYKIHIDS